MRRSRQFTNLSSSIIQLTLLRSELSLWRCPTFLHFDPPMRGPSLTTPLIRTSIHTDTLFDRLDLSVKLPIRDSYGHYH